jgi:hypothetical protein
MGGLVVTAQVQQRPMGSMNDLQWADAGDPVQLTSYAESVGVFWAASVPLPAVDSTQEFRVLIREYERFTADEDIATGNYQGVLPYTDKLVYAASFPVAVGP